jgi:hypothetical protein
LWYALAATKETIMTETCALTFLDETGDTTICWDEDTAATMVPIIERKMAEGYKFYIIKPVPLTKMTRLGKAKNIAEVSKAGSVVIKDAELEQLFLGGKIATTRGTNDNIDAVRKATSANDVATNQSVGVRAQRGG